MGQTEYMYLSSATYDKGQLGLMSHVHMSGPLGRAEADMVAIRLLEGTVTGNKLQNFGAGHGVAREALKYVWTTIL